MDYVQVKNGQIVQYALPLTGVLSTGETISGYNLLPDEILRAEGWLPLVKNIPTYDSAIQMLSEPTYIIEADKVTANYTAIAIPAHVPTELERINAVEDTLIVMLNM